jgi:hypothetical protein
MYRMIEGAGFSEISGHAYQTARCHIPEGSRLRIYICSKSAVRSMLHTLTKANIKKNYRASEVSSLLGCYAVYPGKCLLVCTASYPRRF